MGQIPSCTCAHFTSSLIPCAGICAVYCRLVDDLFDVKNLQRRWRIDSHPLDKEARVKLNLTQTCSDNGSDRFVVPETAQSHLDMTAYQSIVYPSKRDVRYTKLNNLFKSIEPAAINSEHHYKLLTLNLLAFQKSMHGEGTAKFVVDPIDNHNDPAVLTSIPVLPPRKRGRGADDINRY
jgi:hypothetical protein